MKRLNKKKVVLACLSLALTMSAAGVATVSTANASANGGFEMKKGAGLYLDEVSGLKFVFTDASYNADNPATYGILIVPYDYITATKKAIENAVEGDALYGADINDYVNTLKKAAAEDVIDNEPIVKEVLYDAQNEWFSHSIGGLYEYNYAREFFGIGYKVIDENTYEYATENDNVRSVFEVANLALNANVYDGGDLDGNGELSEEETKEKNKIDANKTVLEDFLTTGLEFVYGENATLTLNGGATYVGGTIAPTVTSMPEKAIELDMHWRADTSALSRGASQTISMGLGGAVSVNTTVDVLKDATELQIYNDSGNAYFFETVDAPVVNNTYTVKMDGGFYRATNRKSGEDVTGYLALKNPDSADGKYALEAGKGWSLDFYFKGNNMPNVEFFADSISSTLYKEYDAGRKGYLVTNGLGTDYLYARYNALTAVGLTTAYTSDGDKALWTAWSQQNATACVWGKSNHKYNGVSNYETSFFQYGVTAYDGFTNGADNKASLSFAACDEQTEKSPIWYYSSSAITKLSIYHSDFSMESLMKDETKEWHYVVGMYLDSSNNVNVESYLYEIANGVETLKASFIKTVETTTEARKGYIVVHSALKGVYGVEDENYIPTHLAYTMPKQITK